MNVLRILFTSLEVKKEYIESEKRYFTECLVINTFSDVDECQTVLCSGGKTCSNTMGSYKCACRSGFTGANCQMSKYTLFIFIDILSLLVLFTLFAELIVEMEWYTNG